MERLTDERWVVLPLDKLVKADWNYKEDDPAKAKKLAANVKRNGQIENLLIRELPTGFYEVVNGNHRLDTFVELGMGQAVCYNLGRISDAQARRVAIETNETRFKTDNLRLAELFKEIGMGDNAEFSLAELAETMPFTGDELKTFIDMVDFDWSQYDKSKEGDDDAPPEEDDDGMDGAAGLKIKVIVACPKCGHQFLVKNSGKKNDSGILVGEHEGD